MAGLSLDWLGGDYNPYVYMNRRIVDYAGDAWDNITGKTASEAQAKAAQEAAQAQIEATRMAIEEQRRGFSEVAPLWDQYRDIGGYGMQGLYEGDRSGAFDTPVQQFQYNEDVNRFLDPSIAYQQQLGQRAIESSAANQGGLLSGATLKALQDRSNQIGQMGYAQAYDRMQSDRAQKYGQFLDYFQNQRQANQDRYSRLANFSNLGTQAAGALTSARTGVAQNVSGLQTQMGQAQGAYASAPYLAQAEQANATRRLLGTVIGTGLGYYAGGPKGAMMGGQIGGGI